MRLTRGPRWATKPSKHRSRTAEEARIQATFRAFKAGLTGQKGEGLVAAALLELGVPALHDVIVRDSRGLTQIDHLVRTLDGIVVLETKHYGGIISGEVDGQDWKQRFEGSPERFVLPNPLRQNYRHRVAVEALVATGAMSVRAHVVATGKACFEGELGEAIVPLAALGHLMAVGRPVSQQWLDTAWHKLEVAALASPDLREAHRRKVSAAVLKGP
jgi:restriction system protein